MITILKWIVLTLYNILPDSPFTGMVENLELQQDFLEYLNWFLPIDIMGNMMLAWLDCILLYVLFYLIAKLVKMIVDMVIKAIGMVFSLFVPIG